MKPDYAHGIVNLMRSIEAGCGGAPRDDYPPLDEVPPGMLGESRHVVLLVIDGLGHDYLLRHARDGALAACLSGPISSVFPSTTTSAVTTFLTGEAPAQHGLTGWYTWFREIGVVGVPLPFRTRTGRVPLERLGVDAAALFAARPIAARLGVPAHIVLPRYLCETAYTRAHAGPARVHGYRDLPGLYDTVAALCREKAPGYVYAYWPELDAMAHGRGMDSPECRRHLAEIDAGFARLLERTPGATLLVTADHGFVDTVEETRIVLDEHPELAAMLALPLCGEPRAAWCYPWPEARARLERYVAEHLGDASRAEDSRALIDAGWFGHGRTHPELRARVGDVALIMRGAWSIGDRLDGERPGGGQVGVHGGTSAAEMRVPLVVRPA